MDVINENIKELKEQVIKLIKIIQNENNNESDLLILKRLLFSIEILEFNNRIE